MARKHYGTQSNENFWKIMENKVRSHFGSCLSHRQAILCKLWLHNMNQEYFASLCESMPTSRMMEAVCTLCRGGNERL